MGKMNIRVRAEREGKNFNAGFVCEFDDAEIRRTMQFIDDVADENGLTPEAFTQGVLRNFPSTGWMKDAGARQVQMMSVAYIALQLPTCQPDKPRSVYNYAATSELEVLLELQDDKFEASIRGRDLC